MPISGSMKSCPSVRVGLALGCYSWPALEYSPISSFFLRAWTLITGWPFVRSAAAVSLM